MDAPRPDVVILGASNVSFSLPTIVRAIEATFDGEARLWCVHGLGRSYGQDSRFNGRKLDGILQSAFWDAFAARDRPGPVFALMTDLGNDLIYDAEIDQILLWATECAGRLRDHDAALTMTRLPAEKILALRPRRYRISQQILFPGRESDYDHMRQQVRSLDALLPGLAAANGAAIVPTERRWYGLDPIHLRERWRRYAWRQYLGQWPDAPPIRTPLVGPLTRLRIHRLPRAYRWIASGRVESPQPSLVRGGFEFHQW